MNSLPSIRPRQLFGPRQAKSDEPLPPRRKSSLACSSCRAKKSKCDGHKPFCSACMRTSQRCVYDNTDGRKRQTWKTAISDLEHKNEQLEIIMRSLKGDSFDEAVEQLRRLRELKSPNCQDEESSLELSQSTSIPSEKSRSPSVAETHPAFADVHEIDLPLEDITRQAMSSFFGCGAGLFYFMPEQTAKDIIDAVYEKQPGVTKMMVCQLCALAAVGSHYCTDQIPAAAKEKYFQYASLLLQDESLQDESVHDAMGVMRVYACLALYMILLKSTSARTMALSGLNVVRCNMQLYEQASDEELQDRVRVLRTLGFIECWLSSSLGYKPDLRPAEVDLINNLAVSEAKANPDDEINRRLIQSHVFKIAHLSTELFDQVRSAPDLCMDDLCQLSAKLDTWLWELPKSMRLGSLGSADSGFDSAQRPVLFLHMIHVTSQITLWERVMLAIFKRSMSPGDELIVRAVFRLPVETHRIYEAFAQHLSRMVRLLYDEDCILAKCWLTIHSSFHASLVLLLSAAQHLALGENQELAVQDLAYVHVCLKAFKICQEHDIAAMRLVDIVVPLYQRLLQAVECSEMDVRGSTYALSDEIGGCKIPAELAHIIHQSVAAMALPYAEVWL